MIVLLSQILGHLFKNSVLKYIHNSKHVFSFLPSNPNIKDITGMSSHSPSRVSTLGSLCVFTMSVLKCQLLRRFLTVANLIFGSCLAKILKS